MNGERFAVMAGLGFDANVIRAADKHMKHVLGRMAYVWAAARNLRMDPFEAWIEVDGKRYYKGPATLILFGNVGRAFAGLEIFEDAKPDDGLLEVGVADAEGIMQWGKTIARKHVANSPFVHMTKARSVEVKLQRKIRYEVDGSERTKEKEFSVKVEPGGISICVPPRPDSVPLLVLVLVSLAAGVLGAYVISRERFHALATGGTPGFAAERRDAARAWLAHFHHRTAAAWLALGAAATCSSPAGSRSACSRTRAGELDRGPDRHGVARWGDRTRARSRTPLWGWSRCSAARMWSWASHWPSSSTTGGVTATGASCCSSPRWWPATP